MIEQYIGITVRWESPMEPPRNFLEFIEDGVEQSAESHAERRLGVASASYPDSGVHSETFSLVTHGDCLESVKEELIALVRSRTITTDYRISIWKRVGTPNESQLFQIDVESDGETPWRRIEEREIP